MEGMALAVCEILRYLIIHWKCETVGLSKGALLEGQLVISTEALNSKHQANALHCVTTIASVGSNYGGLALKNFLKEIQSILLGMSAKLMWTLEETSCFPDTSGVSPFQMIFEVDEKHRTLMTDCLAIKNFLRKIIMVHPKMRFHFSIKVNGTLSKEIFGVEDEPILNLPNGIALVVNYQHYISMLHSFGNHLSSHLHRLETLQNLIHRRGELVVPDVSYQVESREGDQSQNTDPQGHTLLLFLFVDFHSGFPVQRMELWGIHTLLTTHLNAILLESQRVVQDSIQIAVDQALEQHHQAAKAHQKLQAFHAVAVNSIMSVVTGSTNSSFRKMCLQAFQATDTREFGTKLHKAFNEITQHRFLHHCSCGVKQLPAKRHDAAQSAEDVCEAQSAEDACESRSPELLPETSAQAESKRYKKSADETRAFRSTRAASPPEAAPRRPEPAAVSLGPSERQAGGEQLRAPAPRSTSPTGGLEEALWLQEVSNLSEWLSSGPGP